MAAQRLVVHRRIGRSVTTVAFVVAVCAGGVARAGTGAPPTEMEYLPGQTVPAGYHVERRVTSGLVASGLIVFGIVYLPTAAAAFYDTGDGTPLYVVPVLGPLLAIPAKTSGGCGGGDHNPCIDFDGIIAAFLIADSLVQAAGAAAALKGFAGHDVLVRDGAPRVSLLPGPIAGTGYGAWLTGRF
jgi:hypothetical protein